MLLRKNTRRKAQGLVEYALLTAGVALICAAAVSIIGHKTNDMLAAVAAILPGAHTDDNAPIISGHLIETAQGTGGAIALNVAAIAGNTNKDRLALNVLGADDGGGFGGLVLENQPTAAGGGGG
jgi:Flp pilus assembly pilin Flp